MRTPIRLGAIGCGPMSTSIHFPGIQRIPELKLTALCDIDGVRLADAAKQFGVEKTYADMEAMLDSGCVDAVSIIGPPALHVLGAKACLRRQIPFLTEKPLALSLKDARDLAELAARHGDCGQVGFTSRYSPAQRLARRIAHAEDFGPVTYVATEHLTVATMHPIWGYTDFAEGFVHLHGVHAIDLWRFFGGDPTEASASLARFKPLENGQVAHGSVLASVRSGRGAHGTIHMKAGSSHNADINADIMGEQRRIRVDNDQTLTYENRQSWVREAMGDDPLADIFFYEQPTGQFIGTGLVMHSYPDFFRYQWIAFARALIDGKPLSPSISDGCKTVSVTEAICESLRQNGEWVRVEYV